MKPDLDLVEPRGVCGSEMKRQPPSSQDPFHNIRVLVEGQVVYNNVKVLVGMGPIQPLEEIQKDIAVVAVHAAGFHRTLMHGERSQQTRGSVTSVGCRMPFGIPRSEREFRLSPIQSLYLRLLIHAKNQRILRRIQIQANNSSLLGLKFGIWTLAAPVMNLVGLELRTFKNPVNCRAPQTSHASKLASAPCIRSVRRLLTRQTNHLGSLPRRNSWGTTVSGLVLESVQSFVCKALAPLHTIRPVQSAACAHLLQRQPICRQQNHLGTSTITLLSLVRPNPHFQPSLLLSSQPKFYRAPGHGTLP